MRVWWWMKKDIHASRPKKPGRVNDSMNVHSDRCFFLIWRVVKRPRLGLSFLIIAFATSLSALNHEIPEVTGQSTRWTRSVVVCYGFLDLAWHDAYYCSFAWINKNSLQSIQKTASKLITNACPQALIRRLWLCWKCYSVPSAISACLFSLSSSIDLARLGSYLAAHIRSLSIYPAEKFAELEATLTLGDFTVLRSNCVNCRRPQVGSLWWYAFSFCWLQCFYCSLVHKHMASLQSPKNMFYLKLSRIESPVFWAKRCLRAFSFCAQKVICSALLHAMNMTWWPCPERAQESSCGASERSLCCDCHWHVRLRTFLCWSYFSLIGLDPCWAEQQSTSTSYLIKRALDSSHNTISMCDIQAFYWRHVCYILRTFMVVVHTKIDCTSRVDDQMIPHFANLGARISPNP